jgi:hypothetical protein
MRTDFLQTLQMKYRAEMLAANTNIRTYIENPMGIGEHSDLIESVDVEVRKYNEAKELITSVSNLIEFYKKKQVEQEQKVAPQPIAEPQEPQEPQGPRTTEPVSE